MRTQQDEHESFHLQHFLPSEEHAPLLEVDRKLLLELEAMGFPWPLAIRALHNSGNTGLEAAVNWIIDHENEPDSDEMPPVAVNIDIESECAPPSDGSPVVEKIKSEEIRHQARRKREEEEKKREREREKERIRTGKELVQAKRTAEENERARYLALKKAEKEEEKKAREKIIQKLKWDKLERRRKLGLPLENSHQERHSVKLSAPTTPSKQNPFPVNPVTTKAVTKAEVMGQCLRSLRRKYKDDDARVKRAFQTLLIYVRNVVQNPDEDKYRKIRISNPLFEERVGSVNGGLEFLELCGFERRNGFLILPREKVDMEILNSAGSILNYAMRNPFFGLFQRDGIED